MRSVCHALAAANPNCRLPKYSHPGSWDVDRYLTLESVYLARRWRLDDRHYPMGMERTLVYLARGGRATTTLSSTYARASMKPGSTFGIYEMMAECPSVVACLMALYGHWKGIVTMTSRCRVPAHRRFAEHASKSTCTVPLDVRPCSIDGNTAVSGSKDAEHHFAKRKS